MSFRNILIKSITTKPRVNKWFYISARRKDDGSFAGAVFVEEENFIAAGMKAMISMGNADANSFAIGEHAEVSDKDLPPEEYRNRKLTLEEVKQLAK